ncbi:MAG: fibronectin type III domain-containing protein, partial [Acidobacteria bacterium]|nr:fibronectin type III domain-containing protein [Acidobacteriota bacterium]
TPPAAAAGPGATAAIPAPPPLPPLGSTPIVEWPPASRYELYEVVDVEDGAFEVPRPLDLLPLTTTTYPDKRVEFGVERCYAVVTLDVVAGLEIRSALSAPTCVTFLDTFAPQAPTGLNAVGTDGAVSLSWQPNEEDDVAGYLVLRGVAPGDTLHPLADEPVQERAYLDDTAAPGVRYVYAVQAVDDAVTPNMSVASETAEATAR